MSEQAVIYTDGSCIGNPGRGGWAYVITAPGGQLLEQESGCEPATTNNRMEMIAIAAGLERTAGQYREITVYSDSKYCVDAFNQRWLDNWQKNGWRTAKRQPVKNPDLWQRILKAVAGNGADIAFRWVKGHAGHSGNEAADRLALAAAMRQ